MVAELSSGQVLISSNLSALPNGDQLGVDVIQQGDGVLVGHYLIAKGKKGPITVKWCGYCDGQLVGCLDCPGGRVDLNCVNKTVHCY